MEFSAKDLEDIQRVAGLLNLTVDELIQQRRGAASSGAQIAANHPPPRHSEGAGHASDIREPAPTEVLGLAWQHVQTPHHHAFMDLDGLGINEHIDHHQHHQHQRQRQQPVASQLQVSTRNPGTDIVLLNPQTTWYDCDAAVWDFDESAGGGFTMDDASLPDADADAEGDEADSVDPGASMQLDSEVESNFTARGTRYETQTDGTGTDWAIISSSPGSQPSNQPPMSPTTGTKSLEKRYHRIAPKTGRAASQSTSQTSSSKIRKKRSAYHGAKKADTHLTRQVHACVRCRMQRNRCVPDPSNPRGPCLTCQHKTVRMSRLPCLRYMVTDSILFRTGLDYMPFYKSHPMIGPYHGDFHLERQWAAAPPKVLCLGQLNGPVNFKVELRKFIPPANSADLDLKGRPMYAVPWAIADPDAVVVAINEYIDRSINQYIYEYLDDSDSLRWNIFQQAFRASVFPTPNRMLQKTMRLWVACRFVESKWRCWADGGFADDEFQAANPKDPFYDWDSLPPYLDYQIASIIIHRVLTPLRRDVLRELQGTFNTHSPKDWFVTFLTSFVLLQNYEMQMQFQRQFAARRKADVCYLDMPLVRATNSGAKTILAHFHYCYKGQQLFTKGFDWNAPRVRRMARLDPEQTSFMGRCRDVVVAKAPIFQAINHGDVYHQEYWFTSQLFDSDWSPRDTLEHAPPVETLPADEVA